MSKYTASNTFNTELSVDDDRIVMFMTAKEILGSDITDEMAVSGGYNMNTIEYVRIATSNAFGLNFESNIDKNDYIDGKAITEATFKDEETNTVKYVKMITSSKLVGNTWHIRSEVFC